METHRLTIKPRYVQHWRDAERAQCHCFDDDSIQAVNAALAAERPLLVRGEPGTGKSQLARAVAEALGWQFLSTVIDSRTEARDLLWSFDAVARLGKAQLLAVMRAGEPSRAIDVAKELAEADFVRPGPLWRAFDWPGCQQRCPLPGAVAKGEPWKKGVVLLVDEIDKADVDVPNGLLEALGAHSFQPPACAPVRPIDRPPLVVLTTNNERALPDAFVRRCVVLTLPFPDRAELKQRARAHFNKAHDDVILAAIEALEADRSKIQADEAKPGQAELFDLLRAVSRLDSSPKAQLTIMKQMSKYTVGKYRSS